MQRDSSCSFPKSTDTSVYLWSFLDFCVSVSRMQVTTTSRCAAIPKLCTTTSFSSFWWVQSTRVTSRTILDAKVWVIDCCLFIILFLRLSWMISFLTHSTTCSFPIQTQPESSSSREYGLPVSCCSLRLRSSVDGRRTTLLRKTSAPS